MEKRAKTEQLRGKITAIKIQAKNKRRVSIFLDGEYAFGVQIAVATHLSRGQTLTEKDVTELLQQDEVSRAYHKSLNFLAYRTRSRQEITRYLQKKNFSEIAIAEVLEKLVSLELIDDAAFARQWVENRESFKPRSRRALRYELRQKGISDHIIDEAVEDIDEEDSAYRAAKRWAERKAHLDYNTFRRKLWGYLQRRGFGYSVIKKLVEQLWQEVTTEAVE